MRKLYFLTVALFATLIASAQSSIDLTAIDTAYTDSVNMELVINVAKTASKVDSAKLWFPNPFKGKSFTQAEISFDVNNYDADSVHVLGSLLAFYDNQLGRMYFTNGSYLGYNAIGGWFDANLKSYAIDSNFIGANTWKNIRLQFTESGYAVYVNDTLAYNQSSTDVTLAGTLTNYSNVITFLENADSLVIGTGSWWSDNKRSDGSYFDNQYSYLKNIKFSEIPLIIDEVDLTKIDTALTDSVNNELVIDVAKTASKLANPKLFFQNPFKNQSFDVAEISFDVNNYDADSIHVLGSLLALYDAKMGRMYFTNGSYLGYNGIGGWFDANLSSYALDSNFIGANIWKNVKLQFSPYGYSVFINDTLAYNQTSTFVTKGGTLTNYSNVINFLQNADTLVIGTGSWWSDNTRGDGSYFDAQYSYMKNIKFNTLPHVGNPVNLTVIDTALTDTVDNELVIDVAKTASKVTAPKLWFFNPLKGKKFTVAEISFDVNNYEADSIHVLGSLLALYEGTVGRMYFTNGSYLGYNGVGGYFDANLKSYALDSNFIGANEWKNIKLQFTGSGYAVYVNNTLAYNQNSADITKAGTLTNYSNVLNFLKSADTVVVGTGSWWSDNTRDDGSYFDAQYSYLKNIKFSWVIPVDSMVEISAIDTPYTKTVDNNLVIDVATTSSELAAPKLWFMNPFKGKDFNKAVVSFDVNNYYPDSLHVLGSLIAFYDAGMGRLYFTNGSYLGYNGVGGYYDANLISYGLGTDYLGGGEWKSVRLEFTNAGYALYVDSILAYNQNSTDITKTGTLTDYTNVITFLQNADSVIIGTGSWWSDNQRSDGSYYDAQYSYMKNIKFSSTTIPVGITEHNVLQPNGELIGVEYYNLSGQRVGTEYNKLRPGIYIMKSTYSNGAVETTKLIKFEDGYSNY